MKCLALDFGGSALKYCLMDENAEIEEQGKAPAPLSTPEQYVNAVEAIHERFEDQIEGIAISMPGQVDPSTGFAYSAGAYFNVYGKNLFDMIHARIPDIRLAIENDGRCGALAEVWKGALVDCKDAVAVILGTGIGGGVIKDRRVHRGKVLCAGELSAMMVGLGEYSMGNLIVSHSGMMGILSKVIIAKNIDPTYQDNAELLGVLKAFGMVGTDAEGGEEKLKIKVDGVQFFKWLEEGDPIIQKIYEEFIQGLAWLAINIEMFYDPERIVIGGGLSRQPRIVPDIRDEVDKFFKGPNSGLLGSRYVEVAPCKFLAEANMVGAMYNYLIHYHPELAE